MNFMQTSEQVLANLPMKVNFAGFTSDTMTLQRNGWQLLIERSYHIDCIEIIMKHEKSDRGYFFMRSQQVSSLDLYKMLKGNSWNIELDIVMWATDGQFRIMPKRGFPSFYAMDTTPLMTEEKNLNFRDMNSFFRTFDNSKELVVDPNDVNQLMDIILKNQKPRQESILRKKEMDERIVQMSAQPLKNIHLQLVI